MKKVIVFEDGKLGRGTQGLVVSVDPNKIVINMEFMPWPWDSAPEGRSDHTFIRNAPLWEGGPLAGESVFYCKPSNHFYREEQQTKEFFNEMVEYFKEDYVGELYEGIYE